MLRKLNLLVPPFLQRLDRHLLLHHPGIWATKIHYVLFFGAIGLGLVFLKTLLEPVALYDVPNPENGFYVLFLPVALAVGVWAFFVYLFRPDRSYGELRPLRELSTQLLYLLGLAVLVAAPFVYGFTLTSKINHAISDEQLQEDMYVLNLGEGYFSGNHPQFEEEWESYLNNNFAPYALEQDRYHEIIEKLQSSTPAEQRLQVAGFLETLAKYCEKTPDISVGKVLENFEAGLSSYQALYEADAQLQANRNLSRLVNAKESHSFLIDRSEANVLLFSVLLVGFAFIIFVRSNWKQFLFGLVASIGGAILLAVLADLGDEYIPALGGWDEPILFTMGLSAFMAFLVGQGFSHRNSRGFTTWKSVSLIMAAGLMPLLFLMTVISVGPEGFFHFSSHSKSFSALILFIFFLTLLLWNTVFSKRFRDIQSAPTSN